MAAPAVSVAGQGRIYFDSTSNKFKVSEHNGAYVDLVGGGGSSQWTTTGSDVYYSNGNYTSGRVGIGNSSPQRPLHITTTHASTPSMVVLENPDTTDGNGMGITFRGTTTGAGGAAFQTLNSIDSTFITHNHATRSSKLSFSTTASGTIAERILIDQNGNVGIGTPSPVAKLDVQGQIVSKVYDNGAATTFDLNNGNSQYTTASCGAITLQNMVDGGSYTLAVRGATSGTCTFTDSAGSRTFRFSPANGPTTASTHTIYSMQVMGAYVYLTWVSGF